MSIIISSGELSQFTNEIQNHFDSFSQFHSVIFIKEPLKQLISVDTNNYNGYGDASNIENYSFIPRSGVYNVMTYNPNNWEDKSFDVVPLNLLKGDIIIKVEEDAKEYAENGKNHLVILDNENYSIIGGPLPTNYGEKKFWYYSLERTT